jgi:hypothetical protein
MQLFKKIYIYFSPYANYGEKRVNDFFSSLNEHNNKIDVISQLTKLVQYNIIATNLWAERRYKGYKYLTRPTRKNMYKNAELIKQDFTNFATKHQLDINDVLAEIGHQHARINHSDYQKLIYLRQIMAYLSPKNNKYQYRASSSFGELLQDPSRAKLRGDCNQIVSLYIFLYSLKYNANDLQLAMLPGHVALNFKGVDIEATNASFANYANKNRQLSPVCEIISINLLDTTDSYYKTHKISSHYFLQASRLAYLVSSHKNIVSNNLKVAYSNLVTDLVKSHNYQKALIFAKQSNDVKLLHYVSGSAVNFYLANQQFNSAKKFVDHCQDSHSVSQIILQNEAGYYYNLGDYSHALAIYRQLKDTKMAEYCYAGLFSQQQQKLGSLKTVNDIKNNKKVILKMADYAKKSGQKSLINYTNDLKNHL